MNADVVRIPRARLIVGAAAIAICAGILILSSRFNFYLDEWTFIVAAPDWTWTSVLQAHNEHPVMIPRVIYAGLLHTVGLRSYVPYMAVLLLLHATNVVVLFELVRRRSGDLVGVAAAALLLVLGAGWENLLWAFQITFVGSVACGLGALLSLQLTRSRRSLLVAIALTSASVMFSGIGLFFVVATAARLALEPARRRDVLWLAPLAIAILAWYVTFGRGGQAANPPPTAFNLVLAPIYTLWGLGAAAAGLFGESGWWGPVALALAALAVGGSWRRQRPDAFALSVAAGLLSFYFVTGLSRAQFGYEQSGAGRYVYEGAVFWLLLLGDAAHSLPWRGTWRPALVAVVFLACFNSGMLLVEYAAAKTAQMQRENADLQALDSVRGDPCLNTSGAVDPLVLPEITGPVSYYRAVDSFGDPAPPLPATDAAAFARARANVLQGSCR